MKLRWLSYGINHWVLVAQDNEVLDQIHRDSISELFRVASNNKIYADLESAMKVTLKARQLKGDDDDRT